MRDGLFLSGMGVLKMMKKSIEISCLAIAFIQLLIITPALLAAPSFEVNGHLKIRGDCSWHDTDSLFSLVGSGSYLDGATDIRLKNDFYFSKQVYLQTHYEAVFSGGDTRRKTKSLLNMFGLSEGSNVFFTGQIEDDRRLMDLTCIAVDEQGYIGYHRLDRLALGIKREYGSVVIGRQAQTWGNGMIFNPMDLFNPFSPTDIQRDYKTGDDMISAQLSSGGQENLQVLYVPRRNADHDVDLNSSSLAAKWHFAINTAEFDVMGARHYEDYVVGIGSMGYIKSAAWRMDGTWTFLNKNPDLTDEKEGFLALATNLDYSWVWWGKNLYGFLEIYHHGLGRSNPIDALGDKNIIDRVSRGELFTLGRNYVDALLQCELHPLFNGFFTVIENLDDQSEILLPRAVWDMAENIQLTFGAAFFLGGHGTEYGGIKIPMTDLYLKAANNAFIWCGWYF
jgi:hypothetical protein